MLKLGETAWRRAFACAIMHKMCNSKSKIIIFLKLKCVDSRIIFSSKCRTNVRRKGNKSLLCSSKNCFKMPCMGQFCGKRGRGQCPMHSATAIRRLKQVPARVSRGTRDRGATYRDVALEPVRWCAPHAASTEMRSLPADSAIQI